MQANLRKAVTLLEPMAAPDRGELRDRLNLAESLVQSANFDPTPEEADDHCRRAREILDALTPAERATPTALSVRQVLWSELAERPLAARDYAGARAAYQQVREAAEEGLTLTPDSLSASRNLSLAYKRLGATMEMLQERPGAVALYEKALDLDRKRVEADPTRAIWRLDLSFAHGAIGAALMGDGDYAGARTRYEEAVALREQVVREDPGEDFAKVSLARGYERLAIVRHRLGDIPASLGYARRRVQIYRDRLQAHPERDNVWREYTQTAFLATQAAAGLLNGPRPIAERREIVAHTTALLDAIAATQERWARDKRAGTLPPAVSEIEKVRAQLR